MNIKYFKINAIRRLWRAIKREILLGDILALEKRLQAIEEHGLEHYDLFAVAELRGTLALARARLASDEFQPSKNTHHAKDHLPT